LVLDHKRNEFNTPRGYRRRKRGILESKKDPAYFYIFYAKEARTMGAKLKKVECDPKCGFVVQSHDEKEIVEIALQHAKKSHNMEITEKDVKDMMKDAA
jgi:predicted small metal-binding protein